MLGQHYIIQGGPKNRTCLSVDNSAVVTRRKVCDMSQVLERCRPGSTVTHPRRCSGSQGDYFADYLLVMNCQVVCAFYLVDISLWSNSYSDLDFLHAVIKVC